MKRNIVVVLAVTILVGSMVVAVVPAEPSFADPTGDVCGDEVDGNAPTFTVTNGVVSAGGDCTGAVVIPEGVTEIGDEAFKGSDLTSVVIPASVTSIGRGAFRNTGDLTTASFAEESRLETIGVDAFMNSGLTSVGIPATVTAIGQSAFKDTASLATVTFAPDSQLGAIAPAAFENSGLQEIVIPPLGDCDC